MRAVQQRDALRSRALALPGDAVIGEIGETHLNVNPLMFGDLEYE